MGTKSERHVKVFMKLKGTGTGLISKAQSVLLQKRALVHIPNHTRLDPEPGDDAEICI
jgi:hypothetical protein